MPHPDEEQRDPLIEAMTARARAEAAEIRADAARGEAEWHRERADEARQRASFLARVTRRMAASMDYETTLHEVVSGAIPFVADWCLVSLRDRRGLRLIGFAHRDSQREDEVATFAAAYQPAPTSSISVAMATGEAQIGVDLTAAQLAAVVPDPAARETLERLGVAHFATWPIPDPSGRALGTLTLVLGDSGRRFADDDLIVGETLAARAGLHITNARLYTERSEIAQTLQQSLLPAALPKIPGLDLAAAFLPVGLENIVGGDFYDVFRGVDGRWTAVLGDVSGKGAQAAAVTATARYTLRAAGALDPDPTRNLSLLDSILHETAGANFCSVVIGRIDVLDDRAEIELATAGHPYPLIVRAHGSIEPVTDGRGPVVGVVANAVFTATQITLRQGDLLVLYTDGVTEVITSDPDQGERELARVLHQHRGQPADAIVSAVTRRALDQQAGFARDDIAVLAVRVPA